MHVLNAPPQAPPGSPVSVLRHAFRPAALSESTLGFLARSLRVHDLPAGPLRLPPALHGPAWWWLAQGRMAMGDWGAHGQLIETRVVQPGQWFDVASAWSGAGWIEEGVCCTPVVLWALPLDALVHASRTDDQLMHGVCAVMSSQVRWLTECKRDLVTKDVCARVAQWLLGHAPQDAGAGPVVVTLTEQKRSIARQLATTAESLSRSLSRMVRAGLIEMHGYQLVLRDVPGLQSLARSQRPSR